MELSHTDRKYNTVKILHLHLFDLRESVTLEFYLKKVNSHNNQTKRFPDPN